MKRSNLPLTTLSISTLFTSLHKISGALLPILVILGMLGSAALAAPPSSAALAAPGSSDAAATADDFFIFSSEPIHSPKWFHWMSSRSLRLDTTAAHNPHIAYGGDHLYYAHFAGGAWQLQTVDGAYGVGKYASLALDSNNRPHISYYDTLNGALKYATYDGSNWQIRTIESAFSAAALPFAGEQSLEIDPELAPRSSDPREWDGTFLNLPPEYLEGADAFNEFQAPVEFLESGLPIPVPSVDLQESSDEQIAAGSLDPSSSMSIASIDGRGFGLYTSIAIGPFNRPAISYYDATNGDLKFARWNGSAWEVSIIDSGGDVGLYTSLAIDSSGYSHISYYDATNQDLKYARWNGINWEIRRADTTGDVGLQTSLALDVNNRPHISYYDSTQGNLKHARWTGSAWEVRVVDSPGNVGMFSSIALTSANAPVISYYDHTNARLKYARWTGSAWEISVVANIVGRYTSLALINDSPRISLFDFGRGQLRYAFPGATSGWTVSAPIDQAADVGSYVSMKLDSSQRAHISYYDDVLDDLWYARWNGSTWNIWLIDQVGAVGRYSSLALDAAGNPRISYYDDSNNRLKFAAYSGGVWQIQSVTGGQFGVQSSLALDSSGNPRIAFYDNQNGDLKVAVWSPTSFNWIIRTVDSDQDVGRWPSLAIDASNQMHISYYHATDQGLKYARLNADGSTIAERIFLTGMRGIGNFSSLALDSGGNPHIAFFNDNADDLMYIRYQGGWGAIQTVDSWGIVGWDPSLALDSSGNPHISYYDYSQRHLRHAYWTGSQWKIGLVDDRGEVGEYSAMVMKDGTTPQIAYYDRTNGDLKLATARLVEGFAMYLPMVGR
jgi:hypothetical protein